jgi:CSLREA domain-containing protein
MIPLTRERFEMRKALRNSKRVVLGTIGAMVVSGCFATGAGAATITPNITADEFDNSGGVGDTGCSLREAISIANANVNTAEPDCSITGTPGADTVSLTSGSPYILSVAGAPDDTNTIGDLDVDTSLGALTIDGAGATSTTIQTAVAWNDRVVDQPTGSGMLTVSDLTLKGGNEGFAGGGGGIRAISGPLAVQGARITANGSDAAGGGIEADSGLSITDSLVDTNTSSSGGGGGGGVGSFGPTTTIDSSVIRDNSLSGTATPANGGGISANNTALTMIDSIVIDNDVTDADAAGSAEGGGMSVFNTTGTIRGSTISDNKVLGGALRSGAGLRTSGTTDLKLVNSTVSANKAEGTGGSGAGLRVGAGTVTLVHTTLGPNPVGTGGGSAIVNSGTLNVRGSVIETSGAASACLGTITSLDDNVFTDTSCGPETGNDDNDADPMLGPLADNGGPDVGAPGLLEAIFTHLPAGTSPVVDHVPAARCLDDPSGSLLVDQRGLPRPDDGNGNGVFDCEAGSIELQISGPFVPPPPPPSPPSSPTPTATAPSGPTGLRAAALKKCKKKHGAARAKCKKKANLLPI